MCYERNKNRSTCFCNFINHENKGKRRKKVKKNWKGMWGIAFWNQYINNLLAQRISWFFTKMQIQQDRNRIHQLPSPDQFLLHFSVLFQWHHFPVSQAGNELVTFDVRWSSKPRTFRYRLSWHPLLPFAFSCQEWPPAPRFPTGLFAWQFLIPRIHGNNAPHTVTGQQHTLSLPSIPLPQFILKQAKIRIVKTPQPHHACAKHPIPGPGGWCSRARAPSVSCACTSGPLPTPSDGQYSVGSFCLLRAPAPLGCCFIFCQYLSCWYSNMHCYVQW